jgi:non-canonical purine NTP pyrophosphatase (RdgB/HAM1 family)
MTQKFFITGNKNKFKEIANYIPGLKQLEIEDLPEIQSLEINEVIEKKLLVAANNYSGTSAKIIVEDTGLYLKALNNFPGPLIKFLLKSISNDGIYDLCNKLGNYNAYATSVFGLIETSSKNIEYFEGTIDGTLAKPKGEYGFGWDAIFKPLNSDKTFAEMQTIEEKNLFSMRYIATVKLKEYLLNNKLL